MKTIKKISLLVAGATVALFTSCSSGPSVAAEEFYTNFAQGNYTEAKNYCTESTKSLVDLAVGLGAKPNPDYKMEIVKDSVADNKAWVWFINEKGKQEKMELTKIDGQWLVDITK